MLLCGEPCITLLPANARCKESGGEAYAKGVNQEAVEQDRRGRQRETDVSGTGLRQRHHHERHHEIGEDAERDAGDHPSPPEHGQESARGDVDGGDERRNDEVEKQTECRRAETACASGLAAERAGGDAVQDADRPRAAAQTKEYKRIDQIDHADGEAAVDDGFQYRQAPILAAC